MVLSPAKKGLPIGLPDIKSYSRILQVLDVPNLIQTQLNSYEWFKTEALTEVFDHAAQLLA